MTSSRIAGFRRAAALLALLGTGAGAQSATPGLGVVRGRIVDAVGGSHVAGAMVQFVGDAGRRVYSAETDSLGRFVIDSVIPGTYAAGFFHPAIEDLGVRAGPQGVDIHGGENVVALTTPTAADVRRAICSAAAERDSTGLVVGSIVSADADAPLVDAEVSVEWYEMILAAQGPREDRRLLTARTDSTGRYAACGVPLQSTVAISARFGTVSTPTFELQVPAAGVLRQRLLINRDTSHAPMARLRGVVRSATTNQPLKGASLVLRGTSRTSTANTVGGFALDSLPAGTQGIDVRAVGYTPVSLPVGLRPDGLEEMEILLDPAPSQLAAVQVFGKAPEMTGFERRRRRGMGRILTHGDLERRGTRDIIEILRMIPGMRILSTPTGHVVRYRSGGAFGGPDGCSPAIFLNAMKTFPGEDIDLLVGPGMIDALEVYAPHEAPAEFLSPCASILIWSGTLGR